jgi:four helix bundle protein
MKDFHALKVWQKAHQLTLAVYQVTATFPREELYGLTSQLRRSCSSIPANLAEGCGRNGDAEFARFSCIAMGSASELEYHLLLGRRSEADQAKGLRGTGRERRRGEAHADRAHPKAERRPLSAENSSLSSPRIESADTALLSCRHASGQCSTTARRGVPKSTCFAPGSPSPTGPCRIRGLLR